MTQSLSLLISGLKPRPPSCYATATESNVAELHEEQRLYNQLALDSSVSLPPRHFTFPVGTSYTSVVAWLQAQGFDFSSLSVNLSVTLKVTQEDSYEPGRETIGPSTTLLAYHDRFLHHRRLLTTPSHSATISPPSSVYHREREVVRKSCIPLPNPYGGGFQVNTTHVDVQRTLRVPEGEGNPLPAGEGSYALTPLHQVANPAALPQHIRERGGLLLGMWQCEALMLEFASHAEEEKCDAVKITVSRKNAITGLPANTPSKDLDPLVQDYIIPSRQKWIDGICIEPGLIRQFVAAPLASASSSAGIGPSGQTDSSRGIQLDFFRRLNDQVEFVSVHHDDQDGSELGQEVHSSQDFIKTPEELGWKLGQEVTMKTCYLPPDWESLPSSLIQPSTSSIHLTSQDSQFRGNLRVLVRPTDSDRHYYKSGQPVLVRVDKGDKIGTVVRKFGEAELGDKDVGGWVSWEGNELNEDETLEEQGIPDLAFLDFTRDVAKDARSYEINRGAPRRMYKGRGGVARTMMAAAMPAPPAGPGDGEEGGEEADDLGVTVGGKVVQRIYRDKASSRQYDTVPSHRVFLHAVSPKAYELITSTPCPPSPITQRTYKTHNIPWRPEYGADAPLVLSKKDESDDDDTEKVWTYHLEQDEVGELHGARKRFQTSEVEDEFA